MEQIVALTGEQIQWLYDKFNLEFDLDEGCVVARRKDGKPLKAETVAKMIGLKYVPTNWHNRENGEVSNL